MATAPPCSYATTNPGTDAGAIPAKVSENIRPSVIGGLAKLVELDSSIIAAIVVRASRLAFRRSHPRCPQHRCVHARATTKLRQSGGGTRNPNGEQLAFLSLRAVRLKRWPGLGLGGRVVGLHVEQPPILAEQA